MPVLTIDRGNSLCKVTLWDEGSVIDSLVFSIFGEEDILNVIEKWKPSCCALCCVGHIDTRLIETVRKYVEGKLLVLTPSVPLPFSICYKTKNTLGVDRIAAAAGAAALFKNSGCLVVDCGTAITLDIIDSEGNFRGGNISPGLKLRMKSLNEYTALLPQVSFSGDLPAFGYDTDTAIRSGIILGVRDEIEGVFTRASAIYGVDRIVMTGGDATLISELFRQENLKIEVDPYLVGRGLVSILEYNLSLK